MEEVRRWIGASASILVESTGDSEAQCSDGVMVPGTDALQGAEDDAHSCIHGLAPEKGIKEEDECIAVRRTVDDDYGYDGGEYTDEEDGVVEQCRRDRGENAVKSGESTACVESDLDKAVNEKERDKLFWEACLAPETGDGDGFLI